MSQGANAEEVLLISNVGTLNLDTRLFELERVEDGCRCGGNGGA